MTKECVIKNLFGILEILSVNVCDKSCDVGEYSEYKNCKCRNRLVDKLVERFIENIDGNKMLHNEISDICVYKKVCDSCTIYMVLFAIFFMTSICISSVFIYFHWYLKNDNFSAKFNPSTQTTIY